MSETVHTSITLALISGLVMALAGVLLARFALNLMGTPNDVIDQSVHPAWESVISAFGHCF